ncbi:hypothetical protein V1291_000060 [Nitrobacteraceae bacterium AZCC 1564]
MKIKLQPMLVPGYLLESEETVNQAINIEASINVQRDQEYALKRKIAADVLASGEEAAPTEFAQEAALMGISVFQLATIISEKPDEVLARGLRRRADVLAIRNAKEPSEIEAILDKYRPA